jgi:probable H4MPT-linked C1 transfer pathway protein
MTPKVVIGWDVGGVNTKAARVRHRTVEAVINQPYELQRAPGRLSAVLRELAASLASGPDTAHAVTMTAELSQMFRTKREGVQFVLDAVGSSLRGHTIGVFCTDGRFRDLDDAGRSPLLAAAANWLATAEVVATYHANTLLIDIGTTTTDIVPIVKGTVVANGRTDVDRLASGELVYTGALRTPIEAIVSDVPLRGRCVGVSAEGFALIGDVHLYRGALSGGDYSVPTPDGRPATKAFALERLARVVCGDRELLDVAAIAQIAESVSAAQVRRIADAIRRVLANHPAIRNAVVTGMGDFIAAAAAQAAGLNVIRLADTLGADAARCAPAAAVALLLERDVSTGGTEPAPPNVASGPGRKDLRASTIDAVIKFGGGVLADPTSFRGALTAVQQLAERLRVVIVPGGGPFADAVREADRRLALPPTTSHWMAVQAMDQYAELLVSQLARGVRVDSPDALDEALDHGRVPVLAPARWLRRADPLPHSWDVTSDSLAAWVSAALGARLLLLVKPAGVCGNVVDPHFAKALAASVTPIIVPADRAAGMLPEVS